MITRREYLKLSAAAGVALAISPKLLLADDAPAALITREIPGTGERLPVVGLGSSASFSLSGPLMWLKRLRGRRGAGA